MSSPEAPDCSPATMAVSRSILLASSAMRTSTSLGASVVSSSTGRRLARETREGWFMLVGIGEGKRGREAIRSVVKGGAGDRLIDACRGPRNDPKPSFGAVLPVVHSYSMMAPTIGEWVALSRTILACRNLSVDGRNSRRGRKMQKAIKLNGAVLGG